MSKLYIFLWPFDWCLAPAAALFSKTTLKHCSDFTFLKQQKAQSYKTPSLTLLLSVFTRNNEAYISQEDDHLTHLSIVQPEDHSDVFFSCHPTLRVSHCFSQMTYIFNKCPDRVQCRNALNMKAIKYPTIHGMYTGAVWYFSDWVLEPPLSMG